MTKVIKFGVILKSNWYYSKRPVGFLNARYRKP